MAKASKYNQYIKIGNPVEPKEGFDPVMIEMAQKDPRILMVLEDMGGPGIKWFAQNMPERVIECGVAEANAAVVCGALAAEGFIPVVHSFDFALLARAYNQIRQSILVDRFNVKLLGRGGAWGDTGISHNYVETFALMRCLPNLVILSVADVVEAKKAFAAMLKYVGPVFIRQEAGPVPPTIYTEDYPFQIGKAYSIKDGNDATIIATGLMVGIAIEAEKLLEKEGYNVGILDMSTLKPLDEAAIIKASVETGAIVTAENGSIIGGLGEGVAAVLCENAPCPMVRFGVEDEFSQSGRDSDIRGKLANHFALTPEDLAVSVKEAIAKKKKKK
ncbi:MAG: transketolase family protein [Dehalococcoidales bacterium]|nr:transketolase family protein [Dehalococcoidales bacterium]